MLKPKGSICYFLLKKKKKKGTPMDCSSSEQKKLVQVIDHAITCVTNKLVLHN
jgi:hypothetical protein